MVDSTNKGETQLVVFMMNEEEFACDINNVREVVKMLKVTPLPSSKEFIEGVINMRGEVIPVIDLRKRFGLGEGERNEANRIIITEMGSQMFGLIVDAVSEVARLSNEQIQEAPAQVAGGKTELIKGVGKINDRMIIILDIEHILSADEQVALDEVSRTGRELVGS